MIADQDRSGYFGASDVGYILGRTTSKNFKKWWLSKMGIPSKQFKSRAMYAGTHYEHRILEHIGVTSWDKQIILEDLKLRVNLDGDKDGCIYEVKTYKSDKPFKMPKKYVNQVQVQMYATGYRKAKIILYSLTDADYKNFFNPIDSERIKSVDIAYDVDFVNDRFLPRLKYYAECLEGGYIPQ